MPIFNLSQKLLCDISIHTINSHARYDKLVGTMELSDCCIQIHTDTLRPRPHKINGSVHTNPLWPGQDPRSIRGLPRHHHQTLSSPWISFLFFPFFIVPVDFSLCILIIFLVLSAMINMIFSFLLWGSRFWLLNVCVFELWAGSFYCSTVLVRKRWSSLCWKARAVARGIGRGGDTIAHMQSLTVRPTRKQLHLWIWLVQFLLSSFCQILDDFVLIAMTSVTR